MSDEKRGDTIDSTDLRSYFKRWPRFYYFVGTVFGPMYFTGLSAPAFLLKYPSGGRTLNIGSGPRRIAKDVMNVDIHPYPGVDIVTNGNSIPLPDNSVARIVSDNVLEHVDDPHGAVREMHRLLSSGGTVYVSTPFLYPFHSSPSDHQRWTVLGLERLFSEFEIVEIGVRAGPFSALTVTINHILSISFSFGSKTLASLILNSVMFVTFPIKLLDIIGNRLPGAEEVASVLYLVARKK